MSLTSYRAAPSRDRPRGLFEQSRIFHRHERTRLLSRFGGDLLSHVLRRSTIGVLALNGRVRDGIGCLASAMTTKPRKKPSCPSQDRDTPAATAASGIAPARSVFLTNHVYLLLVLSLAATGSNQANRAISTGQLNALLHLHLRPIDVVVFHGPQGIPGFEGGFTLRCLQRLSCPFIATQHYRWHDNWSTSGTFTPVLSY